MCVVISDGPCPKRSLFHGISATWPTNSVSWNNIDLRCNIPGISRGIVLPLFESLKTFKKTPVSEVDVEYRHAQQASGLGPSVSNCCKCFRRNIPGRLRMAVMVSWLALLSILSIGLLMAYGVVVLFHSSLTAVENSDMVNSQQSCLRPRKCGTTRSLPWALRVGRKRMKTWVSCCGMEGEPGGVYRFMVNFLPGDRS